MGPDRPGAAACGNWGGPFAGLLFIFPGSANVGGEGTVNPPRVSRTLNRLVGILIVFSNSF